MATGNKIALPNNSRYGQTNLYQDTAGTMFFGLWQPLGLPEDNTDVFYTVRMGDAGRLDLVAYDYYNDPSLWWVIADFNNIVNQFDLKVGDMLRIPAKKRVMAALSDLG